MVKEGHKHKPLLLRFIPKKKCTCINRQRVLEKSSPERSFIENGEVGGCGAEQGVGIKELNKKKEKQKEFKVNRNNCYNLV